MTTLQRNKPLQRSLVSLIALVLIFSHSACGENDSSIMVNTSTVAVNSDAGPTTINAGPPDGPTNPGTIGTTTTTAGQPDGPTNPGSTAANQTNNATNMLASTPYATTSVITQSISPIAMVSTPMSKVVGTTEAELSTVSTSTSGNNMPDVTVNNSNNTQDENTTIPMMTTLECYTGPESNDTCMTNSGKCYTGYDMSSDLAEYSCTPPFGASSSECVSSNGAAKTATQCIFCCSTDLCNQPKSNSDLEDNCKKLSGSAPPSRGVVGGATLALIVLRSLLDLFSSTY